MQKGTYYIITINTIPLPKIYTSLLGVCSDNGISYNTASRGKRVFIKGNEIKQITEACLVRIKGRGKSKNT